MDVALRETRCGNGKVFYQLRIWGRGESDGKRVRNLLGGMCHFIEHTKRRPSEVRLRKKGMICPDRSDRCTRFQG